MDDNLDLIIKGGTVVLLDEVCKLDIGIKAGRIVCLEKNLEPKGTPVIRADNKVVMSGMVDVHVHFNEPGYSHWEGFSTGSASLAVGGCTTYIDMPLNGVPPTISLDALNRKLAAAQGNSYVDYALWGGLVPGNRAELRALAEAGVIGFKAFMSDPGGVDENAFRGADDWTLLEGMKEVASFGGVVAVHAESEMLISQLTALKLNEGKCSARDFVESRPIIAELEAVNRALFYAGQTGCGLHFVHISSVQAVEAITRAKRSGLNVTVETCPHYLALTDEDLPRIGALAKCAPPLRSREEQEQLWSAVIAGEVDIIASDHSPCPGSMKEMRDGNFFAAWGGISGAQSSLELVIGEGHIQRGIPLPALSRMLSYEPARRFGLASKGQIIQGADADLVFVDLNQSYTLQAEQLQYKHPHSPYAGKEMLCKVMATICRGKLVYEAERGLSEIKPGQWIRGHCFREG